MQHFFRIYAIGSNPVQQAGRVFGQNVVRPVFMARRCLGQKPYPLGRNAFHGLTAQGRRVHLCLRP
jgi:hypothetical protein